MTRRIFAMVFALVLTTGSIMAQDIESQPGTVHRPEVATVDQAEFGFNEAYYNAKQQKLRERPLEVPIGDLPADRDIRETEERPPETDVHDLEKEASFNVVIRQNRALADGETNNGTSTVCEPSLAVRGQEILVTGNWFASFSRNGGASFSFRNPSTSFPQIPGRPFCCDQVAYYVKSHDLMVWYLQYSNNASGNTVRLAVAHGADIPNEAWRYYDFTPQSVGQWTGEWFDYPDIAHSNEFLFVTTNSFSSSDQFRRSVALRIPLNELRAYDAINYRYFHRSDVGSLRPTQNAGNTMYIGAHVNTGRIRVYRWADNSNSIQNKEFNVQAWVRRGASAPGPDGRDWLGFSDGRITAAWSRGNTQGFGWTSAQGGAFGKPNTRVAVINWNAGNVVGQPHIWNNQFAFAYPAVDVNSSGQVGISLGYGGGSLFPSCAVGVINDDSTWSLAAAALGTSGPSRNRWGDYVTLRKNGLTPSRFAATGFSLSGGASNRDIVSRLVQFDAVPAFRPSPSEETGPPKAIASVRDKAAKKTGADAETGVRFSMNRFKKNREAAVRMKAIARTQPGASKAVVQIPKDVKAQETSVLELPDIGEFFFEPSESVCFPDNREQILNTAEAPWNGLCFLIITLPSGNKAVGTGWFLSPTLVVTAGHCVHQGAAGDFFDMVEVIPAANGLMRPFGSQAVAKQNFRAASNWTSLGNVADDYGAIILNKAFDPVQGKTPTVFKAAVLADTELETATVAVSGYPADKPSGTQWSDDGSLTQIEPKRLRYEIDTFGGHSGSPVHKAIGQDVVGIHNYGGCPNKCTRITASVMADLSTWLRQSNNRNNYNKQENN